MLQNIVVNNGFNVFLSGLAVVFMGLVLIALVIHLFNRVFSVRAESVPGKEEEKKRVKSAFFSKDVPEDHQAAIAAAIEVYRKLHFESMESRVTFERGDERAPWKTGFRYGQRTHRLR
jgi:Na+-transporting methylmalonyl-CoA/oxaloacetate decarboxylase gamma subunit